MLCERALEGEIRLKLSLIRFWRFGPNYLLNYLLRSLAMRQHSMSTEISPNKSSWMKLELISVWVARNPSRGIWWSRCNAFVITYLSTKLVAFAHKMYTLLPMLFIIKEFRIFHIPNLFTMSFAFKLLFSSKKKRKQRNFFFVSQSHHRCTMVPSSLPPHTSIISYDFIKDL